MQIPSSACDRITRAIDEGVTPGAVLRVADRSGQSDTAVFGRRREAGPGVSSDTWYDLASLTKVVATLPSVLRLVAEGEVALDDRFGRFFSSGGWFETPSLGDVTIRQLLAHNAGLPAWLPLYGQVSDRRTAFATVLNVPVVPPGELVYSDIGYMLLGALVERVAHQRLNAFVQREIFGPLGMRDTGFGPITDVPVAATEDCSWRDRVLEGEVHDENATVWDGIAGHAGLFGTAADLGSYAHAWLVNDERLAPAALLREATREAARGPASRRGLGWFLPHPGWFADDDAGGFGQVGFTGPSIWIEPEAGFTVVLLTNHIHPRRRSPLAMRELRREVHRTIRNAAG